MPVTTRQITVVGSEPTRVPTLDAKPWRALEFDFGVGQAVWAVADEESIPFLPAGSSVLPARLLTVEDYTRNCGFLSGRATYTKPTYELIDKDHSFSNFIADKALNGVGSLNQIVREYEWDSNTQLPTWAGDGGFRLLAKGTWFFRNHASVNYSTIVKVECQDINRNLDQEIFNPLQWTIAEPLSTISTTLVTTISPDDFINDPDRYWRPFEHGAHYHHQPNQTGTFIRLDSTGSDSLDKEIVWGSAMRVDGSSVVIDIERAQRGTTRQAVPIESGTELANGPRADEWICLQENDTTMFELAVTGMAGTRRLPDHWSAHQLGFANAYSAAFHSTGFQLEFEGLQKMTAKQFLENKVLKHGPAVAPVNGRGQLVYTPIVVPTDDNAGDIVLDESNCNVSSAMTLYHKKENIHSEIELKYDFDAQSERAGDNYRSIERNISLESRSFNKIDKKKTIELDGLHSGIHTGPQIQKLAGIHGDANYFELLEISVESFVNDIALGSLVSVQFKTNIVIDDAIGGGVAGPLNRTFTVISATENRDTRTSTYQLIATLQRAQDFYAGVKPYNIEPEVYMEDATDLAPMIASGTIDLVCGEKYYYHNTASPTNLAPVPASVNVNVTGSGGDPQIWAFGFLDWSPDINLTGLSGNTGGTGETSTMPATEGIVGAFGGLTSTGGMRASRSYRSVNNGTTSFGNQDITIFKESYFNATSETFNGQRRGYSTFPNTVLSVTDGRLGGLPADLSGSGGVGGPIVTLTDPNRDTNGPVNTVVIEGGDGGDGGEGLMIVCHGMAMRGRVITSGNDAAFARFEGFSDQSFSQSRGGGGDSGGLLVIVDGDHPRPLFDETNFIANTGDNQVGTRRPLGRMPIDASRPIAPANGPEQVNLWQSRLKILYTPETGTLQELPATGSIPEFLSRQLDGKIKVHIGDFDPSNANQGDARISLAELNSGSDTPAFRVFDPENPLSDANGWRDYDYDTETSRVLYLSNFANLRDGGGDTTFTSPTRPTGQDGNLWHNENTGTIVRLLDGGPPDELVYSGEAQVGSNKYRDGTLSRMAAGEVTWIYTDDLDEMPEFPPETIGQNIVTAGGVNFSLSAVQNLQVFVYSDTQVELIYSTPATALSEGITGYEIYQDNALIDTVTGGSKLVTGLSASTEYRFGVRSVDGVGGRSMDVEDTIFTQPPSSGPALDPVTNLTATVYSSSSLELFWSVPADVSNITGFEVRRDSVLVGTVGNASGSFFQSGLTPSTTYSYDVRSVNATQQSVDVNVQATTNP